MSRLPKIHRGEVHEKGWGSELWLHNSEKYCGKILRFKEGKKLSCHLHLIKNETFYVISGCFEFRYIDGESAKEYHSILTQGMAVDIPVGCPHQLICISEGEIAEFSSQHFDSDSVRVKPGDSQSVQ